MSAAQDRRGFIGGSDAKRIVDGKWLELYEEKVGIRQPEDLSGNFRVQLGKYTERFHAQWLVDQMGLSITNPQAVYIHEQHDWLRGQCDGWLKANDTFIELKHTNARATVRSMSEDYLPQIAHYCLATGRNYGFISFIAGNDEPQIAKIEPSPDYLAHLLSLEQSFWWHVTEQVAPGNLGEDVGHTAAELAAEAKKLKVNGLRFVDMTGNNEWASHAATYYANMDAAEAFEGAKDALKQLVEADVAEASGHGLTIKRNKRGALCFTLQREEAA